MHDLLWYWQKKVTCFHLCFMHSRNVSKSIMSDFLRFLFPPLGAALHWDSKNGSWVRFLGGCFASKTWKFVLCKRWWSFTTHLQKYALKSNWIKISPGIGSGWKFQKHNLSWHHLVRWMACSTMFWHFRIVFNAFDMFVFGFQESLWKSNDTPGRIFHGGLMDPVWLIKHTHI